MMLRWLTLAMLFTVVSTACNFSVGQVIVQVPTPTEVSAPTRRPTYTPTLVPTLTPTPTNTPTETSTPPPTETPTETPTPTTTAEPTNTPTNPPPAQPAQPTQPPEPTATPTPDEPTATPTPAFPFNVVYFSYPTGSPGETRFTAWVRLDYKAGGSLPLAGFQMNIVSPDGNSYLSELSGAGVAQSSAPGAGDNHLMNTKAEIRPYTPGTYRIWLLENNVQVSREVQLELSAEPLQYVHFEFFKLEQ